METTTDTSPPFLDRQRVEHACAGNEWCARFCNGLGRAGLDASHLGEPEVCEVPSLLVGTAEGGAYIEGLRGQLPDTLASALANYLEEHAESAGERQTLSEIASGYQAVHKARDTLYRQLFAADKGGLVPEELAYYQDQIKAAEDELLSVADGKSEAEILLGRAAYDRMCMKGYGIIFTDSMVKTVEKMANNVVLGKPTLLTGDKGIAKTAAVKYISNLVAPNKTPLVISGHGDMMSHELTGKQGQNEQTGKLEFQYGKIIQAAKEGRPVLIDEVNVGDQSVMMRLQDILLLKPGDSFVLQENGQEEITIQPGFAVFMTANEGENYLGRQQLDTAFRDRADTIRFQYPDGSVRPLEDAMPETVRLAFAAAVDTDGHLSDHIEINDLMYLARLAHVSQQLYSQPARNVRLGDKQKRLPGGGAVVGVLDDEPTMKECITPRKMIDVIQRASRGNLPGVTLPELIEQALASLDRTGKYNRSVVTALVERQLPRGTGE